MAVIEIKEKFSIGRLEYPRADDDQYAEFMKAELAAIEYSIDDSVWAVWENESGEVLSIVYQTITYRP